MKNRTTCLMPLLLGVLAPGAFAQFINIDIGDPNSAFGVPSNAYGAAAGQTGLWNGIDANINVGQPLLDIGGAATTALISIRGNGNFSTDNPATTGDDEALMDDLWCPATDADLFISGLADNTYTFYTYAWAPDNDTYITNVDIPLSIDPAQDVGGAAWPMGHMLGITYALHTGIVVSGGNDVEIDFTAVVSFDSCNGIQIIPVAGPLGNNYCGPAVPNSTTFPGVISAFGSALVAANNITLTADQIPPGQFGYFLTSETQGFFPPPMSNGFICLGGNIGRYNGNVGQGPTFSLMIDLTSMPVNPPQAASPGETWNFQAWYRDIGNTNNFTDGIAIPLQ